MMTQWRNWIMRVTGKANNLAMVLLVQGNWPKSREFSYLSVLSLDTWGKHDYISSIAIASILEYRMKHFNGGQRQIAYARF